MDNKFHYLDVSLRTVTDEYSTGWEPELCLILEDSDRENRTIYLSVLDRIMNSVERQVLNYINSSKLDKARQENDVETIVKDLGQVVSFVISHEANQALIKERAKNE